MPQSGLRQAQVDRARPRRKPYVIRDGQLRGFGVRIAPSGRKRFFLHVQHDGTRVWRDCGDAATVPVADARTRATGELAALRGGSDVTTVPFEVVAEEVFQRYGRRWKPRTLDVNRVYYRRQIPSRTGYWQNASATAWSSNRDTRYTVQDQAEGAQTPIPEVCRFHGRIEPAGRP